MLSVVIFRNLLMMIETCSKLKGNVPNGSMQIGTNPHPPTHTIAYRLYDDIRDHQLDGQEIQQQNDIHVCDGTETYVENAEKL
jgi:hypothetical protein